MSKVAYLYPDKSLGMPEERYALDPSGCELGRQSDCGVALVEESVSRRHALIKRDNNSWTVTDLGSSNGTFVNGRQVSEPAKLKHGDVITLGKVRLEFRCTDHAVTTSQDGEANTNGVRMVGDEDSSSVILSTKISDRTPFAADVARDAADAQLNILNQRLLALYKLSDILRGAAQRETIIKALLDLIFESLPADRGVVFRVDPDTEDVVPEQYHFRDDSANHEMVVSRTILRRSLHERVAVLSRDVHADDRFQASESIIKSHVRSAMCVPLAAKRKLVGLLVLDTREAVHAFTEEDLTFVSALATDAAMTLENLELMKENLRQERLAAVGQTISGLAHNIKNILQLARGGTELMDSAIENQNLDEISTLWPITKRSIIRMQALVEEMLDFSRPSATNLVETDLNQAVSHLAELVKGEASKTGIQLQVKPGNQPVTVQADPDTLSKALMNLVTNAFDALEEKKNGRVLLEVTHLHNHPVLRVEDNGPGIPHENHARIFQPFFSTKASKGNGLGLAMTRKYVEDMGAKIQLTSEPGNGCRFDIIFPT